ncbi:IclR family transcriptional regulator [Kutzneria chonburiensis]|uniref:IclR family transcriptional regulator n=1 Tax=Kutzneria chonburiensis TaxID=1483604 RepID=A0ABV6MQI2_9PSEU|nr:IclR family transcriptional regulator [Kutzneria chonburiensis]
MAESGVVPVVKAIRVLRAFTPAVAALSVRQIAARTGIPRSTAHALCQTLVTEGMLETCEDGYQLGPLVLELGGQVIERTGLVRAAEGLLERLRRAPEQEVHLGQLTQGWVVYLNRNGNERKLPMHNSVGQRAPAHLTGCGKAALSWLPHEEVVAHVERCCAETSVAMPDLERLRDELAKARQDGYVVSQSFQAKRISVAAAILDASSRPVGGVSLAGPDGMFCSAVIASSRAAVTEVAGVISSRIINGSRLWAVRPA